VKIRAAASRFQPNSRAVRLLFDSDLPRHRGSVNLAVIGVSPGRIECPRERSFILQLRCRSVVERHGVLDACLAAVSIAVGCAGVPRPLNRRALRYCSRAGRVVCARYGD
jgi:hypothetical protein